MAEHQVISRVATWITATNATSCRTYRFGAGQYLFLKDWGPGTSLD